MDEAFDAVLIGRYNFMAQTDGGVTRQHEITIDRHFNKNNVYAFISVTRLQTRGRADPISEWVEFSLDMALECNWLYEIEKIRVGRHVPGAIEPFRYNTLKLDLREDSNNIVEENGEIKIYVDISSDYDMSPATQRLKVYGTLYLYSK